jgi:hypothetical protein
VASPELHNDSNVYILGAGFSADAGLPLIGNFMHRMRDGLPWLVEQGWEEEVASIRHLLSFRQEAAGAALRVSVDVENIEDLFSLAAATGSSQLESDVIKAIAGTLAFAEKTAGSTEMLLEVPKDLQVLTTWAREGERYVRLNKYDFYLAVMLDYFDANAKDENAIITFNYDTVVESAARRLGLSWDYAFAKGSMRYEPTAAYSPNVVSTSAFQLLKIHGSVSWALPGRPGHKLTAYDSYDDVREDQSTPVLIPPTWKKGGARSKSINNAWVAATRAIETATRIFIIGCSLPTTDSHFRYLMAAGLRNNISLRSLCFVNPKADEPSLRERVLSIFPSRLADQGVLQFFPLGISWLCGAEGRRLLNRPLPEGIARADA